MLDVYLNDGSVIKDLEVNGNCLISESDVDSEKLTDEMLSDITIDDIEYRNITLVRKYTDDGKTYICLKQKTGDELWKEKCSSNIDYLAMMADVDLEV